MSPALYGLIVGVGQCVAFAAVLAMAYLSIGWPLAVWIGRRLSARAIPPPAPLAPAAPEISEPRCVMQIHWWNGCTSEVTKASGIHGANAIAYICSEQPRARA